MKPALRKLYDSFSVSAEGIENIKDARRRYVEGDNEYDIAYDLRVQLSNWTIETTYNELDEDENDYETLLALIVTEIMINKIYR